MSNLEIYIFKTFVHSSKCLTDWNKVMHCTLSLSSYTWRICSDTTFLNYWFTNFLFILISFFQSLSLFKELKCFYCPQLFICFLFHGLCIWPVSFIFFPFILDWFSDIFSSFLSWILQLLMFRLCSFYTICTLACKFHLALL